ncbi:MAG: type II secretion system protein GspG [bacterium]
MSARKKPSLLLGCILNFLWPGIGQMYFYNINRGIVFAFLGLILPGIMFIISCIDLYMINSKFSFFKEGSSPSDISWPEFDFKWQKPAKIICIAGLVLIFVYSIYAVSLIFFITRLRSSKTNMTKQEMELIKQALEDSFKQTGAYPASLEALIKGRPLKNLWLIDSWKTPYSYILSDGSYTLISAGKDRQFETADDLIISEKK